MSHSKADEGLYFIIRCKTKIERNLISCFFINSIVDRAIAKQSAKVPQLKYGFIVDIFLKCSPVRMISFLSPSGINESRSYL